MRVLLVVHGFPPWAAGGTEIYTQDLARALSDRCGDEVFVLTRETDARLPEYHVRTEERDGLRLTIVNNTFKRCRSLEESYRNPAIRRIGADLLDDVRPDVVHIHHLTCLSTELTLECASRHIPTLMTLHDYWLICHRGQLLDVRDRRCDGPGGHGCAHCVGLAGAVTTPAAAAAARALRTVERALPRLVGRGVQRARAAVAGLAAATSSSSESSARRSRHMRAITAPIGHFLALSQTLRRRFVEFGIDEDRITLAPQGIDQARFRTLERTTGDRLRIGFIGSLMISKGPHLALEAFAGLPHDAASLDVFGGHASYHGDDRYQRRIEPLLAQPGVRSHGAVSRDEVPRALASLDVVVVPSIWPENCPLVIREAFAAGVPVVAADLGGMAEMVEHERSGLLFEPDSAAGLRRALRRFLDEPGLLATLRSGIPRVRTIEEDADDAHELYNRMIQRRHATGSRPAGLPSATSGHALRASAIVLNFRTPNETVLAIRSLQASRRQLDEVVVIDNGSDDGSVDRLRQVLPEVLTIAVERNLGFSGGCNVGVRRAIDGGADLVLLVNSDVVLSPGALGRMEDVLLADPDIGIVAPVLLSRAHPFQISSTGIVFSQVTGRMRHHDFGRSAETLSLERCRVVDAVSGCVMLVRRRVFDRIGLLDERYFFQFEDLDFCLRARRAGFLSAVAGEAAAYHEGSVSIGPRSPRKLYFATRNHLLVAKESGVKCPGHGSLRAGSILALNVAFALRSGEIPRTQGLGSVGLGAWHHLRRRYGEGG